MRTCTRLITPMVGVAVIAALFGIGFRMEAGGQPADPQTETKDLEILGHGPIHAAFAQPAWHTLVTAAVVKKKPPELIEELPPDVKPEGDNVLWISGYWAFDSERDDFIWVSGFWRNVPPGRDWVDGYWVTEGENYRWVSGLWSESAQAQVYYPEPPEVIVEAQPPQPNDSSFYVAGTWIYRDTRYLWRPGYYAAYRPGWLWTQPHYSWSPGGYLFVDGFWDHELDRRGVLYAPAYFGPGYWGANRSYRPTFAISTNLLYASLFVRPSTGSYYFGDYYAPRYVGLGFTPWTDYRYRGRYADPAWSYYAWNHRGTPRWEAQTRASYVSRRDGSEPAPSRRFDQRAANQQPAAGNNQSVNLVVPVQQLQAGNNVKFRKVSKEEQSLAQQNVAETRKFIQTRKNVEAKIDAKGVGQQPVKSDLISPKATAGGGASGTKGTQPPSPVPAGLEPKKQPPTAKNPEDPKKSPELPKGKDQPPMPKADPMPKVPVPPQPKGKDQPPMPKEPKAEPKQDPTPKTPKQQPKADPAPKTPAPQPKPAPMPVPVPKVVPPQPMPKAAPAPLPVPKAAPEPAPKAQPPVPRVVPPQPAPRIERPAPVPPRPDNPKGKDRGKD